MNIPMIPTTMTMMVTAVMTTMVTREDDSMFADLF